MHWIVKYLPLRYRLGSRGPLEVDCWGLLRLIYKQEFKIELPEYPGIASHGIRERITTISEAMDEEWIEVGEPFDGAAVGLSQKEHLHHVGVYTTADGGRVIHCWTEGGVGADTIRNLGLKGFRKIQFFKHRKWPTS